MTGVYGIISSREIHPEIRLGEYLKRSFSNTYVVDYEDTRNSTLCKCSLDKFHNDKIFEKRDNLLVATDGVTLNLVHLLREHRVKSLYELIAGPHNEPFSFLREFRGSFVGFTYVGNENRLLLFNDQLGSRPVFYFTCDGILVFGSDLRSIVDVMRKIGYETRLDENAAYYLLTFGHMLGDSTIVRGIKRMPPASILSFDDGDVSVTQYHRLSTKPIVDCTEREIILELYKRFRRSIHMAYSKDLQNGYRHLTTLSGGLDTRNNLACAIQLGFRDITCLTFSQSKYLDHKISERICRQHGLNHRFFPLDTGNYLVDFMDEVINVIGGLTFYQGICNMYPWLRELSPEKYGLLHMGLGGGEIMGLYTDYMSGRALRDHDRLRFFLHGRTSARLLTKISHLVDLELSKYKDTQLFLFYNMGVNGQLTSKYAYDQLIDTSSDHLFLEFLEYALRIPADLKKNRKINARMTTLCFPEFAKYTWEHTMMPPKYPLHEIKGYRLMISAFRRGISFFSPYYSMNPHAYWYRKNKALKEELEKAFRDNIGFLEPYPRLKDDCADVCQNGNIMEKMASVTLLKATRNLGLS
jgi:asparagine synthase (glutamine-hydrolysing)